MSEVCYNCLDPIGKCQCGETETYATTEGGPICPHCGYIEPDAWEIDGVYKDDQITSIHCIKCGEEYETHTSVSYAWTSTKKEGGRDD